MSIAFTRFVFLLKIACIVAILSLDENLLLGTRGRHDDFHPFRVEGCGVFETSVYHIFCEFLLHKM